MPSRAILLLAILRMAAAADPPPRWGAAVAVLPSPPTLVVQGGKVESEGHTYNSAPNSADTYIVPLNASFPANDPPFQKLSPKAEGPSYSWHCLAPLYTYQDRWTMLSFGGDGGWSEPAPGGTDSAWLVDLNPNDGSVNFNQQPNGWANEPSRRVEHSCAAPSGGGKVYITGGQAGDGSTDHDDVWLFDPDPMQFSQLPSLPSKRYGHSSVLLNNGTLLVLGGMEADNQSLSPLNTIHVFDTTAEEPQWNTVAIAGEAPGGRRSAAATLIDNQNVLLFGGANENRSTAFGDAWVFNPSTLQWDMVMNDENGPGARFDAAVAYVGNGQVTIMGGYNAQGPVSGGFSILNVITAMSPSSGGTNPAGGAAGGGGATNLGTATPVPSFLPDGQGGNGAAGTGQNGLGSAGVAAGTTQTGPLPQATQASSYTTGKPIATSVNTRTTEPTTTSETRPTQRPQAEASYSNRNAAIIGSIVASVCVVFFALILFFWCRRRKRDRKYQEELAQRRLMKEGDTEAWAAHITPPGSPKSRFTGMAALGAGVGAVATTLRKISGGRNPEYQAVATDEKGVPPRRRSTRYVGQKMRLVGHRGHHDPFSDTYSEDLPFEADSSARTSAFGPGIASTEVGMRQRQVSNEHSPIPEEDEEIPIGGRWATANLILCDSRSDSAPAPTTSPTRMSRASFLASEDDFNLLAPIPRRPLTEGALLTEVASRGSGVSGASTSGTSMADLANASVEHAAPVTLENDAPVLWNLAAQQPVHGGPAGPVDFAPFPASASELSASDLVPPALLLRLAEHTASESSSVNSKHRMVARAIAEPRGLADSEHGEIDETSLRDSRSSRATAPLDGEHAYGALATSRNTFGTLGPKSPYYFGGGAGGDARGEDPDATPLARQQARFGSDTGLSDLIPDFGSTPSSLIRLHVPSVLERGGSDSTADSSAWGSSVGSSAGRGSTTGTWATAAEAESDVGGSVVSTASTVGTWTTAPPQAPPPLEEELAELREADLATPLAAPRAGPPTPRALSRVDTNPDLACVSTPRTVSGATVSALGALGGGGGLQRAGSGSSTMAVVGAQPSARERALNASLEGIDMPRGTAEFLSPPPSPAPPHPPSPEEMQPWPQFAATCRPSPSSSIFTVPAFPDPPDPFQDAHEEAQPPSEASDGVEHLASPAASPAVSPAPSPSKPHRTLAGMAGIGRASAGLGRQLRPVREAIDSINRRGAGLPSRFASGSGRDFTPTPPKGAGSAKSGSPATPALTPSSTGAAAGSPVPAAKGRKDKEDFHLRPTHRYAAGTGGAQSPVASFRTAAESASSTQDHSDDEK